jgi:hypothetical protein
VLTITLLRRPKAKNNGATMSVVTDVMSRTLNQEIQQEKPFVSVEEEAFLGLQRTASLLLQALGRSLKGGA